MFIQDTVSFITVNIFLVVNISENTGLDSGSQPGFFFFCYTTPLQRHLSVSGDVFGCHKLGEGAIGIYYVESRDAVNILQYTGQSPTTKKYLAQIFNNA